MISEERLLAATMKTIKILLIAFFALLLFSVLTNAQQRLIQPYQIEWNAYPYNTNSTFYNATAIYGNYSFLCLSNVCLAAWTGGGAETFNGTFNETEGYYVYNSTPFLINFNETLLNLTIDARAVASELDPHWTANESSVWSNASQQYALIVGLMDNDTVMNYSIYVLNQTNTTIFNNLSEAWTWLHALGTDNTTHFENASSQAWNLWWLNTTMTGNHSALNANLSSVWTWLLALGADNTTHFENASAQQDAINELSANQSNINETVVHKFGAENIAGDKTFLDNVIIHKNLYLWGNLTNTIITELNVNASQLPYFDDLFSLGDVNHRWKNVTVTALCLGANCITAWSAVNASETDPWWKLNESRVDDLETEVTNLWANASTQWSWILGLHDNDSILNWTNEQQNNSIQSLWNSILWKRGNRFVELNGSNEEVNVSNQLLVKNATETNYDESTWAARESRGANGAISASSSFGATFPVTALIDGYNLTRWISGSKLQQWKAQLYVNFTNPVNITHIYFLSSLTYTCAFHNFTVEARNSASNPWIIIQNFTDNYFNPTAQEQLWVANITNASTAYTQWMINNTDATPCFFTRSEWAELWWTWTTTTESQPVELNATMVNDVLTIRNTDSDAYWQLKLRTNGNITEVVVQDPESPQSNGIVAMQFLPTGAVSIPRQNLAFVRLSGMQDIITSTYSYVNWDNVVTMSGATFVQNCPDNPDRVTEPCVCVNDAGRYRIEFDVGWQFTGEPVSSTAIIRVQPALVSNGTLTWKNTTQNFDFFTAQERDHMVGAWDYKTQHMSSVLELIAGTCVTAAVWHDEGATQKLGINSLYNRMLIYREA